MSILFHLLLLFMRIVAFGYGRNPDLGRETCDVEKTS